MIGHVHMLNVATSATAIVSGTALKLRESDKQKHFWVCFVLILTFFFWTGMVNAVLITMSIGFAKELWDKRYGSGFCWYDMMANTLGAGTGMAVIYAHNALSAAELLAG